MAFGSRFVAVNHNELFLSSQIRRGGVFEDEYEKLHWRGTGSYGHVFRARSLKTWKNVAMKEEFREVDPSLLEKEVEILEALSGQSGIPRVYWRGINSDGARVMVFESLGWDLEENFNLCNRKFSLKTVLMLVDQLIPLFQHIHTEGYIHRAVKPQNIMMGNGIEIARVYVTDIGLETTNEGLGLVGSPEYSTKWFASVNAHVGGELSPRDDLESLGYVLIHFLHGYLPWHAPDGVTEQSVFSKKATISIEELCGDLPDEFRMYFRHVRSLGKDDKPDYDYLFSIFRKLFRSNGYENNGVFDWTMMRSE